jgi:serine/threonine-protein kinase
MAAELGEHGRMAASANELLNMCETAAAPRQFLASVGEIFAEFGPPTQDSGNLSFGVELNDRRFFVKSTDPQASVYLEFAARVKLLHNAIELSRRCAHPLLPALLHVIESASGRMLVYDWVDGELLRPAKNDADSAHARFCRLPVAERLQMLDGLFDLHASLTSLGYVAADFYDGCLIYDFAGKSLHVVDLDHYHQGPFTNEMGRLFGSSRFMAPEEFELGAQIDERTTVFNLGRAAATFLGGGSLLASEFAGGERLHVVVVTACQVDKADRFTTVAAFHGAWQAAR